MKATAITNVLPKNHLLRVALATVLLLLIPLVAMQFSRDVNWSRSDFVIMGTIIFVTGLLLDRVITKGGKYRLGAAGVVVFLFLWLWAELAVGVFTNWGS